MPAEFHGPGSTPQPQADFRRPVRKNETWLSLIAEVSISPGSMHYNTRRLYLAVRRSLSAVLIDGRRGIETSDPANLGDFGLNGDGRVRYEPSSWLTLRRALPVRDVASTDVFVDLGCGKGRVVIDAARRYPFSRIVGIDIAPELIAVAANNVQASRGRLRCQDIELDAADAVEWELPDDVTILFLYNPLRGAAFRDFASNLATSLDRHPRPFRLIYNTPVEHERLMATGRFRVSRETRGLRPTAGWSKKLSIRTYEFVAAAGAAPGVAGAGWRPEQRGMP
jgi:SAM-dependent methyltransferase